MKSVDKNLKKKKKKIKNGKNPFPIQKKKTKFTHFFLKNPSFVNKCIFNILIKLFQNLL